MARVPTIYNDAESFLHRRDPRAKLLSFLALVVLLYVAPTWQWMLGLAALGLGMCAVARVRPKWLAVLWLLQVPNMLGLLFIPAIREYVFTADGLHFAEVAFGLHLSLAWAAALFVSIGLFTTMTVDDITNGLRGLGVPEVACFTVGYTFLLLYLSLSDIFRIADAMKLKGVGLETRNPIRLMWNLPRLAVPAIFTIVRRANTMMAVLQSRGFSFTERPDRPLNSTFDAVDGGMVAAGALVCAVALADRLHLVDPAALTVALAGLP